MNKATTSPKKPRNRVGCGEGSAETPLKLKIRESYKVTKQYHDIMRIVFPHPSAHRCATSGGPPACAMPFGRALREMGGSSRGMGSGRMVWIPSFPNIRSQTHPTENDKTL
jgi:hypothetical protein